MAFVNKKAMNVGITPNVLEFAKTEAKNHGMSLGVYIEQLIRKEMKEKEKEAGN